MLTSSLGRLELVIKTKSKSKDKDKGSDQGGQAHLAVLEVADLILEAV